MRILNSLIYDDLSTLNISDSSFVYVDILYTDSFLDSGEQGFIHGIMSFSVLKEIVYNLEEFYEVFIDRLCLDIDVP